MITVNWNQFLAKFGDAAPVEFERLSYFIFCRIYNRPHGIFRYRNHPALETAPIKVDGKLVGFQSKFFLDKFSNHRSDIVQAVEKVAKHYTQLNRLVFFMPMDNDCDQHSADDGLVAKAQREVECVAAEYGFEIEWFCHSRFEATFSNKEYSDLGRYYFSADNGMFALCDRIDSIRNRFLQTIHDSIEFANKRFKIDRTEIIKRIDSSNPGTMFVLYGDGGVGKSGVIRDLIYANNDVTWVFRAEEIIQLFSDVELSRNWHTSFESVINETKDLPNRIIVIDSAEKIESLESDIGMFFSIIRLFVLAGWKIVFTIRTMFCDMLIRYLSINMPNSQVNREMICPLTPTDMGQVETTLGVALPSEVCALHFLKIPFYLNIYLRNADGFQKAGLRNFKNQLWALVVQDGHTGDVAAACFQKMVVQQIHHFNYWLDVSSASPAVIKTLVDRGILLQDVTTLQYYIAHDVYEEVALEHEIERMFTQWGADEFFSNIPKSRAMIRAFRMWLKDGLASDVDKIKELVSKALHQDIECWRNETLIAILNSTYAETYLAEMRDRLFANEAKFLRSVIKLVRCTCKEPRRDIPGISNSDLQYYFTRPSGRAWEVLISFVCDNDAHLHGFDLCPILDFICEWIQANPVGDVVRKAGILAMKIALQSGKEFETHYDSWQNLAKIITASSNEIHNELQEFILFTLTDFDPSIGGLQRDIYEGVLEHPYEHINFIKEFPELTRQMAKAAWFKPRNHYYSSEWAEEVFGLSGRFFDSCVCPSAYATPIYILLQVDFIKTLDFIVEVVNKAVCHAAEWKQDDIGIQKTKIFIPSGEVIEQYISQPLWTIHRGVGSPVTPYLLQSIHMALERSMIDMHKLFVSDKNKIEWLERVAIGTIKKSKSASLTGTLTSLVLAYPDKYFDLASIIMTSREMIKADHMRGVILEAECKTLYEIYGGRNDLCVTERRETLADKFRSETLESIMLRYQMDLDDTAHERKKVMQSLLDFYDKSTLEEDRFFVLRADSRKQHIEKGFDLNGQEALFLVPDVPDDLAQKKEEAQKKVLPDHICKCLMMWGMTKLKGEKMPDYLMVYDDDFAKVISDFNFILGLVKNNDPRIPFPSNLAYAAAAILRFCNEFVDEHMWTECSDLVLSFASQILQPNYIHMLMDGVDAAIVSLPQLMKSKEDDIVDVAKRLILLSMLFEDRIGMSQRRVCDTIFEVVRSAEYTSKELVDQLIPKYIYLRIQFQKFISKPENRPALLQRMNLLSGFVEKCTDTINDAMSISGFDLDAVIDDHDAIYAIGNAILLITPTHESVKVNEDLILRGIAPVLNELYVLDGKSRRLTSRHLKPFATQYQHQLAKLLLRLSPDALRIAILELNKVPYLAYDQFFFSALIAEEDILGGHDNFWRIWTALIPSVSIFLKSDSFAREFDNHSVIENFLLGKSLWKSNVSKWKSFRDEDVAFYEACVRSFPASLGVLSALASFCVGIGMSYWKYILKLLVLEISELTENRWWYDSPMKNAVTRLEQFVLRVISEKAEQVKKNESVWNDMVFVLDWLVDKQSNLAYQLREQLI